MNEQKEKWVLVGLFTACFTTVVALYFCALIIPPRTVALWKPPEHVDYGPFDDYALAVEERVDQARPWRRRYFVWVGRTNAIRIGREFVFDPGSRSLDEFLREARVEWSDEKVVFVAPDGKRMSEPTQNFVHRTNGSSGGKTN